MTGEEKLQEFKQAIHDWKSSKYLVGVKAPKEDARIHTIINMKADTMRTLTAEECMMYAYELYAYAEYVETVKVKQKNILEWADSSIWYIVGGILDQYGGQYSKWQEKYFAAVRENPLANEILAIKIHAEARVRELEGSSNRLLKMAETLNNLARRK